jgi:hypothetical protein
VKFWQLVKFINGKEVISATPPPDWEEPTEEISDNEANNVPWETARALDIRTRLFTFCDWNPVSEFWAHERWKGQPENAYIHSTYQDATWVLPPEVVTSNLPLEAKAGKTLTDLMGGAAISRLISMCKGNYFELTGPDHRRAKG